MENYLTAKPAKINTPSYDMDSYLPKDVNYITDHGVVEEEEIPILSGEDNILSEIDLKAENSKAVEKALTFLNVFTRVFVKEKSPQRSYNKLYQNKNELPDVELDWIFQDFRVTFLFSNTDDDFYCYTKYDSKSKQYESKSGPLESQNYEVVSMLVMQEVG